MQRARLWPHGWSRGLLGEVQQARLLQKIREERAQGRIGPKDCAHQDEAQ